MLWWSYTSAFVTAEHSTGWTFIYFIVFIGFLIFFGFFGFFIFGIGLSQYGALQILCQRDGEQTIRCTMDTRCVDLFGSGGSVPFDECIDGNGYACQREHYVTVIGCNIEGIACVE